MWTIRDIFILSDSFPLCDDLKSTNESVWTIFGIVTSVGGWRTFDSFRYERVFCSPNRADWVWAHPTLSAGFYVNKEKNQPECSMFWPGLELGCSLIKEDLPPS
jgi:hypothetical protein